MRVAHRGHHPPGHRPGRHPQLGVDAGHHHVEPAEQVLALVERAVLQDVDLDPGQDAERRQLVVQLADQLELSQRAARPTARWPRSAGASGRSARSTRGRARGPPRPSPAAGCRRRTSPSACGSRRAAPQRGRPAATAAGRRAAGPGRPGCRPPAASVMTWAVVVADALQRLQRARLDPALELARRQPVEHLGGPPEGPHAVRRRPAPLQLERDPPQRLHRVILHWVHVHLIPSNLVAGASGALW